MADNIPSLSDEINIIPVDVKIVNEETQSSQLVRVNVSAATDNLIESELPDENAEIKAALKALVEAIKKRTQMETKEAGEFTKESYLNALEKAKVLLEEKQIKLPFETAKVEQAVKLVETEAKKNWENVSKEVHFLGDRLSTAAKTAWEILRSPRQ